MPGTMVPAPHSPGRHAQPRTALSRHKGERVRSTKEGGQMRRSWLALAVSLALVTGTAVAAAASVTAGTSRAAASLPAGDGPPGFWWGTDSFPVTVPGSAPYSMPRLGGAYCGYIGMTGSWSYWLGCKGGFLA